MLKEAAEKFLRFKGHRFPFIGFGVLVFERDLSILIGQYPVIGYRDLENIPGQVLQYLFPTIYKGFLIYHPPFLSDRLGNLIFYLRGKNFSGKLHKSCSKNI